MLGLVGQWLAHVVDEDGVLRVVTRGISLSCPLSPLMGGLYLRQLDVAMGATGLTYVRFMDDWVVLAPTRWTLRRAVRAAQDVLAGLRVRQHPGKTFVGYVGRGFDFLGYRFDSMVAEDGLWGGPGYGGSVRGACCPAL